MVRSILAASVSLACVFATISLSLASELTFHIDPAQSHLTFSLETPDGTQISSAQTPGSDTTSLFGTANIDVTASTIEFLTTNDTQFALQAAPQSPLADGTAGASAAQIGLSISVPDLASGVIAARNYLADASSGVIPLAGGSFDASQLTLNLVTGNTAYNLLIMGSPLVGNVDTNFPVQNSLTGGTLALVGGTYTVTIPVLAQGTIDIEGVTITDIYSGQIVATATVPEPTSLALAALGAVALLACGVATPPRASGPGKADRRLRACHHRACFRV